MQQTGSERETPKEGRERWWGGKRRQGTTNLGALKSGEGCGSDLGGAETKMNRDNPLQGMMSYSVVNHKREKEKQGRGELPNIM